MIDTSRLIIIGASGHGKVVADIAKLNGYTHIAFLDDDESIKDCAGYPVLGVVDCADSLEGALFVAIGQANVRKRLMDRYRERNFPVLIHPNAVVADSVEMGEGSVVMAGAVVNPYSVIGKGSIINTSASVDHDCALGDFVHVSVGAHLCGNVWVDEGTWIGAGAVVSNNVAVCSGCMIGAGAVVVKDVLLSGTYVGVPARRVTGKNDERQ